MKPKRLNNTIAVGKIINLILSFLIESIRDFDKKNGQVAPKCVSANKSKVININCVSY